MIDVFSAYGDMELITSVNAKTLSVLGYTATFAPVRLYGNRQMRPGVVFILNGDNLLVTTVNGAFMVNSVV